MRRQEGGNASVEFIWLALILLVPIVYLMLSVFEVQRAAFATSTASRTAARAFVLAPDPHTAQSRAQRAARVAMRDHNVANPTVSISCRPRCHAPGSVVHVQIRAEQALPLLPEVFGAPLARVRVSATHREPFGSYRSAS